MENETSFPQKGLGEERVFTQLEEITKKDIDWELGRDLDIVLPQDPNHFKFLKKIEALFAGLDANDPQFYPSLRQLEHETVRMMASLFHGDRHSVGVITPNSAESLLLVVKTYRDRAKKSKPWVTHPEIIAPESFHPDLLRVASYLGVEVKKAELGVDFRADVKSVRKLISRNTILLLASVPQYPQGVIDPIAQMGELASKFGIPLHVDARSGGFLVPFMEKLGRAVPAFDFRIPGVMSISTEMHQFGYAGQSTSALLYRSMNLMKHQFHVDASWKGGTVDLSPTFSPRRGEMIAGAWATLKLLGEEGYLNETKKILEYRDHLLAELGRVSEVKCEAFPDVTMLSLISTREELPIHGIGKLMEDKGWRLPKKHNPPSLHITVSPIHEKSLRVFIQDLRASIDELRNHPERKTLGRTNLWKGSLQSSMEKIYGPQNISPEDAQDVESWGDFAFKLGTGAKEVWDLVKGIKGK